MEAMIRPVLENANDPQSPYRNHIHVIALGVTLERRDELHSYFEELYRPLFGRQVAQLERSLPGMPRDRILWALHFMQSAVGGLLGRGWQLANTRQFVPAGASDAVQADRLIDFCAAGCLHAPVAPARKSPPPRTRAKRSKAGSRFT
jgi:hypothetical protein